MEKSVIDYSSRTKRYGRNAMEKNRYQSPVRNEPEEGSWWYYRIWRQCSTSFCCV